MNVSIGAVTVGGGFRPQVHPFRLMQHHPD
jgi:hypothetical protein